MQRTKPLLKQQIHVFIYCKIAIKENVRDRNGPELARSEMERAGAKWNWRSEWSGPQISYAESWDRFWVGVWTGFWAEF